MNLIINRIDIKIHNKPTVSFCFSQKFTVVEDSRILRFVLDSIMCKKSKAKVRPKDNFSFKAEVFADKAYVVTGRKEKNEDNIYVEVFGVNDQKECTRWYLEMLENNPESDWVLEFCEKNVKDYLCRFHMYDNPDVYNMQDALCKLTDGYSRTRTFRKYLSEYLKELNSAKFSLNKGIKCGLLPKDKVSAVDDTQMKNKNANLVSGYLSYLYLNDFWSEVELIRNFNRVNKPLLITDFTESEGDLTQLQYLYNITKNSDRQTILLLSSKASVSAKETSLICE